VREVVAGLLVFLKGLWNSTINADKFHKSFTKGAIEHAQDAWCDTETLSMVTKVDQEMANILTFDTDLIFPEMKLELDMSGASTPVDTIAKIQDDLLLTGSISTFRSTATRNTQATRKAPNEYK